MAKIVFLCMHNIARGQMAVGFAKKLLGANHEIYSAGSHPKKNISPDAIKTMSEIGIDISKQTITSIADLPIDILNGADFIITLCQSEVCPFMATQAQTLHWPISDPSDIHAFDTSEIFAESRNQIKDKITDFIEKHINNNNIINLQSAQ